jgi:hypothetical protein
MRAPRSVQAEDLALSVSERTVIQHVSQIYELGLPVSQDDHQRVFAAA